MDRGYSDLKAKIAQFEAPKGEVNGTPARTTPAQKSTQNLSWQSAEKIKTANKTDFQSYPRNFVEQSCDRKFEKMQNNEQRPKPAIKPLEFQKAAQKSADIVNSDKSEDRICHREEILVSPTAKNHKHIENLSKIISAQSATSRSESSKLKSSPYSTVVPQFPSSQVRQKFPNSENKSHSPVNESSFSGFAPSNPKNISRPDPGNQKAQSSVPKPPKIDVFGNVSAGDRTLHKVAAVSLSNQTQSNEVSLNKTETSWSSQKPLQQTWPKVKATEDKANEHRNPVSKDRHQQTIHPITDVTRNVPRLATDHVTDVRGRRYRKLHLADDIPTKPSKKPPQLPVAIDLETFRPLVKKNTVEETPGRSMPPRAVSMIPEWSVEEEEGEDDQEDYEVCADNCPIKDGYVNEQQLKNIDSFARLKTNTGDGNLSDEEIYESI